MKPDRVLSMLGLAAKAGTVTSGEFSTEKAVRAHSAYLVIVAADASENTQKRFADMAEYHEIPMYRYGEKEALGRAIGKQFRASLAVTDQGLAHSIEDKLKQMLTTE